MKLKKKTKMGNVVITFARWGLPNSHYWTIIQSELLNLVKNKFEPNSFPLDFSLSQKATMQLNFYHIWLVKNTLWDNFWQLKTLQKWWKILLISPSSIFCSQFLYWLLGVVEKQLDLKDKVNFKSYDITAWGTRNCNTDIVQYLDK